MPYQLNKSEILFQKKLSETEYYVEVAFSSSDLTLFLTQPAHVNEQYIENDTISIPLHVGFNYIRINQQKLAILRHADNALLSNEFFRPKFHYSVPISLLNDPNGLVYDANNHVYHLYYQYQGNCIEGCEYKSWGHCISKDLLDWKKLPIAIYPNAFGEAYSGSCVIDEENTSGLFDEQTPPQSRIVALYTSFNGVERQCLAFSKDGGTTFEQYEKNPIIDNFENGQQKYTLGFRDPKVIRIKSKNYPNGVWLMVVAGEQARLYVSKNLLEWKLNDEFYYPNGQKIISECPDFFPLQTQTGKEKWIFLGNDYNNGDSRIFYVVGELQEENGSFHFTAETMGNTSLNLNPEAYASQTYYNDAFGRKIMIAWLRDWVLFDGTMWNFEKINEFSKYWLGTFSLPQQLSLLEKNNSYQLLAQPIDELKSLRTRKIFNANNTKIDTIHINDATLLEIDFHAKTNSSDSLLIKIFGKENEAIEISYTAKNKLFMVDKSKSLAVSIPTYSYNTEQADSFSLRLLVDTSVLEIYINNGEKILSTQFYLQSRPRFEITYTNIVERLNVYELKPLSFY